MDPTSIEGFQHWLWVLFGINLVLVLVYVRRFPGRRSYLFLYTCAFLILPVAVTLTQRDLLPAEIMVGVVFIYGLYLMFKPQTHEPNTPS